MTSSSGMWAAVAKSNWWKSNRRQELPPDWSRIRARVLKRCGYRCEFRSESGVRCWGTATDVDHALGREDRKSTRLNSSHVSISYAVFCLKKKDKYTIHQVKENAGIVAPVHPIAAVVDRSRRSRLR